MNAPPEAGAPAAPPDDTLRHDHPPELEPGAPLQLLRHADGSNLYRPVQAADGAAVLVAVCSSGPAQACAQRRMDHAYALRHRLDPAFATVPLRRVRLGGLPALLLSDPGGVPLDRRLGMALPLAELLDIGIAIAAALGGMHARGLVQQDLRPCNILARGRHQAVLTGFGAARLASQAPQDSGGADPGEGLAYLAPSAAAGPIRRSTAAAISMPSVSSSTRWPPAAGPSKRPMRWNGRTATRHANRWPRNGWRPACRRWCPPW
ncbi:protein kinase family protein [Xylophilus rhododendri]|uniref:hypothetical protein n=1 Tax=Xylophilus rhododendri TaxID=2697032 RepID=UPI001E421889|nr:hypothetical protein [Xylophilus rhododendri]